MRLRWVLLIGMAACAGDKGAVHDPSLASLEEGMTPEKVVTFLWSQFRSGADADGELMIWRKGTLAYAPRGTLAIDVYGIRTTRRLEYSGATWGDRWFEADIRFADVTSVSLEEPSRVMGSPAEKNLPDDVKIVTLHTKDDRLGWAVREGIQRRTLAALRVVCLNLKKRGKGRTREVRANPLAAADAARAAKSLSPTRAAAMLQKSCRHESTRIDGAQIVHRGQPNGLKFNAQQAYPQWRPLDVLAVTVHGVSTRWEEQVWRPGFRSRVSNYTEYQLTSRRIVHTSMAFVHAVSVERRERKDGWYSLTLHFMEPGGTHHSLNWIVSPDDLVKHLAALRVLCPQLAG